MKVYSRNCPICDDIIEYKDHKLLWQAKKRNSKCRRCLHNALSISKIGDKNPMYGKHFSEEARKKQSELRKGKKPYKMTDETRKKMSISFKGRIPWNKGKTGLQMSPNKGKTFSEEFKKKNRIAQLKRFEKLGLPSSIDKGSVEFFDLINKKGFNFKSKTFLDIGYVADGYDEKNHIWIEFDTPYHNSPYQKNKDLIRQENIIKHFRDMGKPLMSFVRVQADKDGKVLETKCVYGSSVI